jgi:hypothetical protein
MKKLSLVIMFALLVVGCKKNKKTTSASNIYCIWYNQTCVGCQKRVFYKCASTQSEMQQACIQLRNDNKEYEVVEKATCSDCN